MKLLKQLIESDLFKYHAKPESLEHGSRREELNRKEALKSPRTAFNYARDVIKGRWPEAEDIISKDPPHAFLYATYIIGKRWLKGEKAISENSSWAYLYAHNIIKSRWPKGEKAISRDPVDKHKYEKEFGVKL